MDGYYEHYYDRLIKLNSENKLLTLHVFDLLTFDLPQYYKSAPGFGIPEEMIPILGFDPSVMIAGTFSNWQPIKVKYYHVPYKFWSDCYSVDGYMEGDFWPLFRFSIWLPPGMYQYKWIVNGEWLYQRSVKTVNDTQGNINNICDSSKILRTSNGVMSLKILTAAVIALYSTQRKYDQSLSPLNTEILPHELINLIDSRNSTNDNLLVIVFNKSNDSPIN